MEKSGALEPMDGRNDKGVDVKDKSKETRGIRREEGLENKKQLFKINGEIVSYQKTGKNDENVDKFKKKSEN